MTRRLLGALAALSAGVVLAGSAAEAEERAIEEIVVTAQRKEQVLKEVPISITAFQGEFLKEAAVVGIHELVRYTPNVFYAHTSPCCSPVFIRGFGSPFVASAFDPTVSFVIDEFSIPKDIYLAEPLYDIQRFEVLRGPQGILFGKNTPAGLFNVTTGQPSRELAGYVLGRIGNLGVHRVEAAIGGPLGPLGNVAQFRLAVMESKMADDVLNTKLGIHEPATEQLAGRLRLAIQPIEALEILLTGSRAEIDATRTFSFQENDLPDSSVDFLREFDPKFDDDGFNHQNSMDGPSHIARTTDILGGNVRYDLGALGPIRDAALIAVVGKTSFHMDAPVDNDFSPADILVVPAVFDYDQRSAEVRATGIVPGPLLGEIDLVAGFLWFESDYRNEVAAIAGEDFEEWAASPAGFEIASGSAPPGGGLGFGGAAGLFGPLGDPSLLPAVAAGDGFNLISDQSTRSQGFFGQAAWILTKQWTVSIGGRLNLEKKTAFLNLDCFDPGAVCGSQGFEEFTLDLDRRETDFSPKVTVQYFPFESLSLFASRAQGYKSGGYNNLLTTTEGVEVEPEETVSWEAGAKGTFFDDTLSWGATFFNMDVDNLQVQQFLGGTTVVVRNAAAARSRGVEADFQWLTPWQPLSFRGAGSYTDGIFTEFPNAPAPRSFDSITQDLSGERMPFVSEVQLNVTPELRFPLPASWLGGWLGNEPAAKFALDVLYRSDMFLDIDLDPATRQEGNTMLHARAHLLGLDDAFSLGVTVENLADNDVLQFATDSSLFPGFMTVQEFQRQIAAEARYLW